MNSNSLEIVSSLSQETILTKKQIDNFVNGKLINQTVEEINREQFSMNIYKFQINDVCEELKPLIDYLCNEAIDCDQQHTFTKGYVYEMRFLSMSIGFINDGSFMVFYHGPTFIEIEMGDLKEKFTNSEWGFYNDLSNDCFKISQNFIKEDDELRNEFVLILR